MKFCTVSQMILSYIQCEFHSKMLNLNFLLGWTPLMSDNTGRRVFKIIKKNNISNF